MADITPGLSADELRSSLYNTFRGKGLLNSLKSQLRSQIVSELRRTPHSDPPAPPTQLPANPLARRIATSLVAEHLKTYSHEYSLAVFLPESGTKIDELLTPDELLHILKTDKANDRAEGESLIWALVLSLMKPSDFPTKSHASQQTESRNQGSESLAARMKQVDEDYSRLQASQTETYQVRIEERMQAYQRQCDARAREEIKEHVKNFKETELARMRFDEREEFQKEINRIRNELETSYAEKTERLFKREEEMENSLRQKRHEQEAELHSQRQALLAELDALRMRETTAKKAAQVEEERIRYATDQLRFKEISLDELKSRMQIEFHDTLERFKLSYMEEQRKKLGNLELKEAQLEEQRARVLSKESRFDRVLDDLAKEKASGAELQQTVKTLERQLESAQTDRQKISMKLHDLRDYDTIQRETLQLKKENDSYKLQIRDLQRDLERNETTHKDLIKELSRELSKPSDNEVRLRAEIKQLRENARKRQLAANSEIQKAAARFQEERGKTRELMHEVDQRTLRERELRREVTNLQLLVDQAQTAYSAEMHRSSRKLKSTMTLVAPDENQVSVIRRKAPPSDEDVRRLGNDLTTTLQSELDIPPVESATFLKQTKQTFERLEKEAMELEKSYEKFQRRLAEDSRVYATTPRSPYRWENPEVEENWSRRRRPPEARKRQSRRVVTSPRRTQQLKSFELALSNELKIEHLTDNDSLSLEEEVKVSSRAADTSVAEESADSFKLPSHDENENEKPAVLLTSENSAVELSDDEKEVLSPKDQNVDQNVTEPEVVKTPVTLPDDGDDDWESRRRQREEERRKREEEARKREQEELAALQEEEARRSAERETVQEKENIDDEKRVDEATAEKDDDAKIDPTMLQYMKLISQKKEEDKGSKELDIRTEKEFDWSIKDSESAKDVVSGGGGDDGASDEEFDW
ncbi:centriole and centriolar satellite protein ofd1-like isoform X1 [Oscarella lobularis]|uniref:centriole and centriolar satellite protein ofd1-like isoform X1 n=1 Tax=Oscarella lobularis TaxID=121494 RepID=UPI003313A267